MRTFVRIAEAWELSTKDQIALLGSPARSTFYSWKRAEDLTLPRDTLERLSYIFGIYKALQILLPEPQAADAWIKKPNAAPLFGGRSALERMLSGQVADLYVVRQYLDAQRG
jgi:antitoxin Xre/MbcA/ParS-like protein